MAPCWKVLPGSSLSEAVDIDDHNILEELHCCACLYGSCLPAISVQDLYEALLNPKGTTYLLLHNVPIDKVEGLVGQPTRKISEQHSETYYGWPQTPSSVFSDVQESDVQEEEGVGDGNSLHEKLWKQLAEFQLACQAHRHGIVTTTDAAVDNVSDAGNKRIERLIAGCATVEPLKDALQLSLLGVRDVYRGQGFGKQLLDKVKAHAIQEGYVRLLVHADLDAVSFFARNGFSRDEIVTRQYSLDMDDWDDSVVMVMSLPLSKGVGLGTTLDQAAIAEDVIDKAIGAWRQQQISALAADLSLTGQIKAECAALVNTVRTQASRISELEQLVQKLTMENDKLKEWVATGRGAVVTNSELPQTTEMVDVDKLNIVLPESSEFRKLMRKFNRLPEGTHTERTEAVTNILVPTSAVTAQWTDVCNAHKPNLAGLTMSMELFTAGGISALQRIATSPEQANSAKLQRRKFFQYSAQAMANLQIGEGLLLCNVTLGKVESVLDEMQHRLCPPDGFDSAVLASVDWKGEMEYHIYDLRQIVPVAIYTCTAP